MKTTENSPGGKHLRTVLLTGLNDILWAEDALVKVLPRMMEKSTDVRLKTAIHEHYMQTQTHVERLKAIFELLEESPEGKTCLAMQGILKEGDELIAEMPEGATRDVAIISASQKIEHYEISTYGTLASFAKTMNQREVLQLLLRTLGEEKKSDCLLSDLADTSLNRMALSDGNQVSSGERA